MPEGNREHKTMKLLPMGEQRAARREWTTWNRPQRKDLRVEASLEELEERALESKKMFRVNRLLNLRKERDNRAAWPLWTLKPPFLL